MILWHGQLYTLVPLQLLVARVAVPEIAVLDPFDQKTQTSLHWSKKSVGFHGSTVIHHTYGCVHTTFPTTIYPLVLRG